MQNSRPNDGNALPKKFEPDPRINYVATIEVPWGTVDRLPDNPGQRDTEGHAVDLLSSGVLKPTLDLHCEISMVLIGYPTKVTSLASIRSRFAKDPQTAVTEFAAVMNDGHSRRHLIRSGHIPCPERFRAKVYTALDYDVAQTLVRRNR